MYNLSVCKSCRGKVLEPGPLIGEVNRLRSSVCVGYFIPTTCTWCCKFKVNYDLHHSILEYQFENQCQLLTQSQLSFQLRPHYMSTRTAEVLSKFPSSHMVSKSAQGWPAPSSAACCTLQAPYGPSVRPKLKSTGPVAAEAAGNRRPSKTHVNPQCVRYAADDRNVRRPARPRS